MGQRTVKVHLRGGLGNQLFQYAAGVSLARRNNAELVISSMLLPKARKGGKVSSWPEQISNFRHVGKIVDGEAPKIRVWVVSRLLQLERLLGDNLAFYTSLTGVYANESCPRLDSFRSLRGRRVRLNSYCNGPEYFDDAAEIIRAQVLDTVKRSRELESLLERAELERPIGLHVRLGDYSNLEEIYGKFDPDYFAKAADLARQVSGAGPIWLFSDDPDVAFASLSKIIPRLEVAPEAAALSSLETIIAMSKMKALICSSSSFSWWGAFLGGDKLMAIFPRPLFGRGGPHEPKDALLKSWVQIGRSL